MIKPTSIQHAGLVVAAAALIGTILPATAQPIPHSRAGDQASISSGTPRSRPDPYYNDTGPLLTPDGRLTRAGADYERASSWHQLCEKDPLWPGC